MMAIGVRTGDTELETLKLCFNTMYRATFVILYYDQPMHNYFTNYHSPTLYGEVNSVKTQV